MSKENRIISVRDMEVKFQVRGNFLTAIRNVDLDIYDQEILAIVGESGSGKSVITKTFTGMLESNGWISNGSIVYRPTKETLEDEKAYFKEPIDIVNLQSSLISKDVIKSVAKINKSKIKVILKEIRQLYQLNPKYNGNLEDQEVIKLRLESKIEFEKNKTVLDILNQQLSEALKNLEANLLSGEAIFSLKDIIKSKYTDKLEESQIKLKKLQANIGFRGNNREANKLIRAELKVKAAEEALKIIVDDSLREKLVYEKLEEILKLESDINKVKPLSAKNRAEISRIISSIEIFSESGNAWSVEEKEANINYFLGKKYLNRLESELQDICLSIIGENKLDKDHFHNILVDWKRIKNTSFINKIKSLKEIRQLRGKTVSTIFQDPMTSLNPLLPVGFQITEVLRKQLGMNRRDAKKEAIELLTKVGIPNAEKRFRDIPGRYSGGMRQRVVIAIALATRPKILICDEPTTALDVTIQAQILDLIQELQQEYKFSVVFITHDLGVVAKIADRVAVMYAGQIVEVGTAEEIFDDPKHPYTWALLSSLPQLGKKGDDLFSIEGTPPSLFNEIVGDAFAPRNKYALELDYFKQPPLFKVSETHYAKTWLLDPRSPKIEKPKILKDLRKSIEEAEKVG